MFDFTSEMVNDAFAMMDDTNAEEPNFADIFGGITIDPPGPRPTTGLPTFVMTTPNAVTPASSAEGRTSQSKVDCKQDWNSEVFIISIVASVVSSLISVCIVLYCYRCCKRVGKKISSEMARRWPKSAGEEPVTAERAGSLRSSSPAEEV